MFSIFGIVIICCTAMVANYERYLYPGHRKQINYIAAIAILMIIIVDLIIK